jgi:hypothetical protein
VLSVAGKPGPIESVIVGRRTLCLATVVESTALVRIIAALKRHAEGVRENG